MKKKQARMELLESQVARVRRRIACLDRRSTRYSWVRVAIFFCGLALSVLVGIVLTWVVGLVVVVMVLLLFFTVAYFHRKVDASLARHKLWLHIKTTHIARMQLDWVHMPPPAALETLDEHPFKVDLDITGPHSLHQLLNTAVTREGSQRLCDWLLTTPPDITVIRRRQKLVRELTPLTLFRDKLHMHALLASRKLNEQLEGKRLLHWLDQQRHSSALLPLLWITAGLNVLTIVLFVLNLWLALPAFWIFTLLATLGLFFLTAEQRGDIADDATYLRYGFATLSTLFTFLETYPYGDHHAVKLLCEPFFRERAQRPSRVLQQVARISSAATLKNNGLLWLLVNAFVPWDIYCAYRLTQARQVIQARLPEWLDTWFELEALCSLATFAYLNPDYILPEVMPSEAKTMTPCFAVAGLGHPLIPREQKVSNTFALNTLGDVVIITGSNMAGKSTFLRTLGVNLCLAYVGGPVDAQRFTTSLFRIFSCIRVSDSVVDGYSYFYAEVRRLKALLEALAQDNGYPLFFLIDEIFKGTNNRERLIGSRSFVRAVVGKNCVGCISTHDLELVRLADILPQVKNYHFREELVDGRMLFDYTLRSGPCPTTNALKIMQMEGLPVED